MRTRSTLLDSKQYSWEYETSYSESPKSPIGWSLVSSSEAELSHIVEAGSSEMDDFVTPNYRALSAKGVIINNFMQKRTTIGSDGCLVYDKDMYWSRYGSSAPHCHWQYRSAKDVFDSTTYVPYLQLPTELDTDALKALAISRVWASVGAAKWQSLVTAAEARKTLDLLTELITLLLRTVRWVRGTRRKVATGALSIAKATQLWLQYRYGIRPAIYEVKQAMEAVKALRRQPRTRYTAWSHDEHSDNDTIDSVMYQGTSIERTRTFSRTSLRKVRVNAGVLVEPVLKDPVSRIPTVFGWDEIFESLWELVPYSFVIDWFVNVGDFIASWTPEVEVRPLASWVTSYVTSKQSLEVTAVSLSNPQGIWDNPDAGTYYYDSNAGTHRWEIVDSYPCWTESLVKTREPNPERPWIPSLNVRLDVQKALDLVALAIQSLKS